MAWWWLRLRLVRLWWSWPVCRCCRLRLIRIGVVVMADVSAVDREAARVLASLGDISEADLEAVVDGDVFRASDFGGVKSGVRFFRPLYDVDGSRLER